MKFKGSLENSKLSSHESNEAALVGRLWVTLIAEILQLTGNIAPTGIERLEFILNGIVRRLIYFTCQVFTKSVDSINFGSVSGTFFTFDLQGDTSISTLFVKKLISLAFVLTALLSCLKRHEELNYAVN